MESLLCSLGCLSLLWTPGTFARTLRICFRVFSGPIAYVPSAMTRRPSARFSERVGREIFESMKLGLPNQTLERTGLNFRVGLGVRVFHHQFSGRSALRSAAST